MPLSCLLYSLLVVDMLLRTQSNACSLGVDLLSIGVGNLWPPSTPTCFLCIFFNKK